MRHLVCGASLPTSCKAGALSESFRDVTTTLITGANKGLGFETARQLTAAGHRVWIAARDHARGRQAADDVGARFVHLDVTDDASVDAAVETVGELDVLVNNAGISGGRISPGGPRLTTCARSMRRTCSDPSASCTHSSRCSRSHRLPSSSTSPAASALSASPLTLTASGARRTTPCTRRLRRRSTC
jgi:short chain dehydrogenase